MPNQKYRCEEACEHLVFEAGGTRKPVISYFSGITVRVCFEDAERRLYAAFGGCEAVFDCKGSLLEGDFPEKQQKYVAVWADMRREELAVMWYMMQEVGEYFKVRGLS